MKSDLYIYIKIGKLVIVGICFYLLSLFPLSVAISLEYFPVSFTIQLEYIGCKSMKSMWMIYLKS